MGLDRLRTALALVVGSVLTAAAFGALLGLLWLPLPRQATTLRLGAVLLAAGLATIGGGMTVGWIAASRPVLSAGIFGALLSTIGSMYVLGPSIVVPGVGLVFAGAAILGALIAQRCRSGGRREPLGA